MNKLRIIFAGTSYFSQEYLNALIQSKHEIVAVLTQPDKKSGRGQKIHFSPVKKLSQKYSIPILQPSTLKKEEIQKKIYTLKADIMIVIAYGQIIPKTIINIFPMGCINVHPSLLPRWRGSTPIQSAIAYGDCITGITIIQINEKIDAGEIICSQKCTISKIETAKTLSTKLIKIGIPILLETLENIITKNIKKYPQDTKKIMLSNKIYKKDALLNWNMPAKKIERLIRAFNPWPICYFKIDGKIIKIWKANVIDINNTHLSIGEIIIINKQGIQINTSNQILNIKTLQLPGKNIVNVENLSKSYKKLFTPGLIIKNNF